MSWTGASFGFVYHPGAVKFLNGAYFSLWREECVFANRLLICIIHARSMRRNPTYLKGETMEIPEAKSAVKALYLQSAALAGLEVSTASPEALGRLVENGFDKVDSKRHPTAIANVLRIIAVTLEMAEARGDNTLHENSVEQASEKICPIYPFGQ